ncbi:D-amino acid dehydrogenase small subunit [Marinovum algicola]|jgi:D-amino-acid dehydrogenase|uniref:D-amino-acid dehydrogenase n=1 Tax=Marinovum algicola TaxID=42444 RepID=A0A975ZNN9_9RHOB|nr:D-amino-acid dehydrogenase [Marinovum algicola]SLN49717.1 D-amino acid dehydrogenase small subunit [Marinovum algicola]
MQPWGRRVTQAKEQIRTAVVGAGIIGTSIAHALQQRGHAVALIDRDAPGRGASFGNMASIAVSGFMPISRPRVWMQAPGWLLDPKGPIRVAPGYAPRLVPWMLRFLSAGRPGRLRALQGQGAALCARALADTRALLGDIGLADHMSETGCLSLYATPAEFAADREALEMLDRFGFGYDVLDAETLRAREPALGPGLHKAVLMPDNRTLRDPHALVTRLAEVVKARGGRLVRAAVTGVERRGAAATGLRLDGGETLAADRVVLAAGAHTGALARQLDEPIPLETERGYHTQIGRPGISLTHALIWPARAFMVSPTGGGIRIGGTVEFAGLEAPPNWRRAEITAQRAKTILPGLRLEETSRWMGHRPALPDTIPVISSSARAPGVFYATGHGHLGMTQAATTAQLMADLVTGAAPPIDMAPYRIDRF